MIFATKTVLNPDSKRAGIGIIAVLGAVLCISTIVFMVIWKKKRSDANIENSDLVEGNLISIPKQAPTYCYVVSSFAFIS